MMILILLALGFVSLFIEFYLPGAVMGILGGCLIFTALVMLAIEANSPVIVIGAMLAVGVALVYLVKFAIWRIRTAKPERSIYSGASQTGFYACQYDTTLIGKKGRVITDLKPGGYISIEGKEVAAISQSGYLEKGTEVLVLGGQEQSLIVKQME